jgi:hypothetical protein
MRELLAASAVREGTPVDRPSFPTARRSTWIIDRVAPGQLIVVVVVVDGVRDRLWLTKSARHKHGRDGWLTSTGDDRIIRCG